MLRLLRLLLPRPRQSNSAPGNLTGMESYLVAGLGNIGAEYSSTRHNMGFMVLDAWAQASNIVFSTKRYGDIAELSLKGRKIVLLKPSTYMNLSGNAVKFWLEKLKIPREHLLVICDDLNIPFGTVRMRKKGSNGGHNGLGNIQDVLGTQDYCRIRVGIGNEYPMGGQIDFVLGKLPGDELSQMPGICEKVIKGAETFVLAGPDVAMNVTNTKSNGKGSEVEK